MLEQWVQNDTITSYYDQLRMKSCSSPNTDSSHGRVRWALKSLEQ